MRDFEKLIDLHTHTIYSDGDLTPGELIDLAKKKNVRTISITDHDTISGNKEIFSQDIKDIKIIPGIELTARTTVGKMHILGYNIDIDNKNLNSKLDELHNSNLEYISAIFYHLKKKYRISFSSGEVSNILTSNGSLGRIDVAKLLIKYGYATTIQYVFKKYLEALNEKTKQYKKELEYEECLDLILKSGGIPVLAHPKTLELDNKQLLILLKEMIKDGLKGIEVYHSKCSYLEEQQFLNLAIENDLLISGGSDYHGPVVKPDIQIGTGKNNNLKIKRLSLLDKLKY